MKATLIIKEVTQIKGQPPTVTTYDPEKISRFINQLESPDRTVVSDPRTFSNREKEVLISHLMGLVSKYKRLYETSFTPQHVDLVKNLIKAKKMFLEQGVDLGPSWETLGRLTPEQEFDQFIEDL